MKMFLLIISFFILLTGSVQQKIDLLVYNATVYTVDKDFSSQEALAVNKGKIIATGKTKALQKKYIANEKMNAGGKYVYPGLIDAHAHFFHYGLDLQKADLVGTNSWMEVIQKLKAFAEKNKEGWLLGTHSKEQFKEWDVDVCINDFEEYIDNYMTG